MWQSIFAQSTTVTPFNAEVVRLGTFISHLESLKNTCVFCHPEDWVSRGMMIRPDCEHLTRKGMGLVCRAVKMCVPLYRAVPAVSKPTLGIPIPNGTNFSNWVEHFREVCSFKSLKPSRSRCDAWRELVPAANSGYATRQNARFFKQTLEFMERICFSSNIGIFDPSPALIRNFNFSILIN
jgi:hypothetical protein